MNIILYSTNCPKCRILEGKMEAKNIAFNVETNIDLMLSKGFTMAPILEVDGVIMDFAKANKWVEECPNGN